MSEPNWIRADDHESDNLCTQGRARLCLGFLERQEIECSLHQGKLDVRDGAPASEALRTYPVRIENGHV